jgi:hypothetical protein
MLKSKKQVAVVPEYVNLYFKSLSDYDLSTLLNVISDSIENEFDDLSDNEGTNG